MAKRAMVRALFGDSIVDTWEKAKQDCAECILRGHLLPGSIVVAFGQPNIAFMDSVIGQASASVSYIKYESGIAPGEGVLNVLGNNAREPSGWRNSINYGSSIWRHKIEAIRLAVSLGYEEILWCDWDTKIHREPDSVLWDQLRNGPCYQGRLRQYHRAMCHWKTDHRRKAFHGACFYTRGHEFIRDAVLLMDHEMPTAIDEPVLTKLVDRDWFASGTPEPQAYRDAGIDNPRLHSTHADVLPTPQGITPYFSEGKVVRTRKHVWAERKASANNQEKADV